MGASGVSVHPKVAAHASRKQSAMGKQPESPLVLGTPVSEQHPQAKVVASQDKGTVGTILWFST